MHIKNVLDNNAIYPPAVLSITIESVLEAFVRSAQNVTAVSLGSGYVTSASASHLILNAFKNLAAASLGSGFGFKEADRLKASAGSRPAAASSSAPTASAAKVEEKVEAPKEEEVDIDMGDLFGY